jgi:hypothetical protein
VAFNNRSHNTSTGVNSFGAVFVSYRIDQGAYVGQTVDIDYGKCTGWGPYDLNDGVTVQSGIHTGGIANSFVLEDSTKNWTANQWQRYGVKNTTTGREGWIYANDATKMYTLSGHSDSGSQPVWNSGNTYEIRKVDACIDQTGWHGGNTSTLLYSTKTSKGFEPLPIGWPNLKWTPFYAWGNTVDTPGVNVAIMPFLPERSRGSSGTGCTPSCPLQQVSNHIPNRDFYNYAAANNPDCGSGFNGTCGLGVGPIAARPATCTTGVAYWATDEGEWWAANPGADGRLYKCTSPNTWTLHYTPYTYPHPLTGTGAPPPPSVDTTPPTVSISIIAGGTQE